ncbi:MAG: hypothetical protein ACI35W_00990 [Anaeroplasmataceae bacterium]
METKEFLEFSKKNREDFLNILSSTKEKNMEFIARNEVFFYINEIYKEYLAFLHKLYDNYTNNNDISVPFNDIIYDFIDSMKTQCDDPKFITKDEYTNHVCCVEYNMIINIHKFSYELFSLNHILNEKDFFHGDSLTYLLEENKITIKEFREESYYDIDNFNHIDLKEDINYIINTTMIDIYMLTVLSDVCEIKDYDDIFNLTYAFNSKKLLSTTLYRYLLTMEDAIKMKKSYVKGFLYIFFIVIIILVIAIFFAYNIIK